MLRGIDKTIDDPNTKWYKRNQRRKGRGPSAWVLLERSRRASAEEECPSAD